MMVGLMTLGEIKMRHFILGVYSFIGLISMVIGAYFAFGWAVALATFGVWCMILWSNN